MLQPKGTLWIRMGVTIGLGGNVPYLKESQTNREHIFYLIREVIKKLLTIFNVVLKEPIKTTNIE